MDVRMLPPGSRVPALRDNPIAKAVRLLNSAIVGPRAPMPRKGDLKTAGRSIALPPGEHGGYREWTTQPDLIRMMAEQDDIVVAIRNTLRDSICEADWAVVPDLDAVKADLKIWKTIVQCNINMPGLGLEFEPQAITEEFRAKAGPHLEVLLNQIIAEGGDVNTDRRIQHFYDVCTRVHEVTAERHAQHVRRVFDEPNPSAESAWHAFIGKIVDDLTMWDAACIIKNPTLARTGIGELYSLPGRQIRLFRKEDFSTPQPPAPAYAWCPNEIPKAIFNNLELVYILKHPQDSGYGKSPLESIVQQMMGMLQADNYMVEQFTNSNVPFGVLDLGPNTTQEERDAVERKWQQLVASGLQKIIFVALQEGVKGFLPVPAPSNKDSQLIENMTFWANRKCAAFGLSMNDIGFTQDLHRTTSETQYKITSSRGIASYATIVAAFINREIVKGNMWIRYNPDDPADMSGYIIPCFPFRDVKFEFNMETDEDETRRNDNVIKLVQAGLKSFNEGRKDMKLEAVEGGDIHVILTGTPLKVSDLKLIPPPQAPQPPGGGGGFGGDSGDRKPPGLNKPPGASAPPQLPKPATSPTAEKRIEDLARSLAKIAGSTGSAD